MRGNVSNQINRLKWQAWITCSISVVMGTLGEGAIAQPSEINAIHPSPQMPRLQDWQPPAMTLSEWLAQMPDPVQITGIRLNPTPDGMDVVLETSSNEPLQSNIVRRGKVLVLEVRNVQLAEGQSFQQDNPIPGISRVSMTAPEANQVLVEITGTDEVPEAEILTNNQFLILSVIPSEPEEEVIVTAQKTPERLQDVPISITVLDEQEIEDADITSFTEVANSTPNFSFFNRGDSRLFSIYSVRGITNLSFASRDAVGFYIDDVPYDYGGFLDLDLIDLQRVEVLRGPQSTLYGRSSLAGVVNIITRKPSNQFEIRGIAGYGSFDNVNLRAVLNVPLIEDHLFFRLSGGYESRDGYTRNIFLDRDADEKSGGTGRAQLLWMPSQQWEISLNTSFDDYQDGVAPLVLLSQDDRFESNQNFPDFNNLTANAQALKVAYQSSDIRVTSITTRRFSNQDAGIDLDYTPADGRVEFFNYSSTVWTQELRLQSSNATSPFQWLLGGYFESFHFNNRDRIQYGIDARRLGSRFPPGFELTLSELNNSSLAAFGQVSYQPIAPLTLTAGLRYESTRSKLADYERTFTANARPIPVTVRAFPEIEQNDDAWLPRFLVQYRFSPNAMLYSSIARGYRPAGVNFSPFSDTTATYEAETSWNYELGFKTNWINDRLALNGAIFYSPVDNFQFVGFQLGRLFIGNANVNIVGGELELKATPAKGFDITAGLGITSAEFDGYTDPLTGRSFDGNQVPYSPTLTYNLGLQYRSQVGWFGRVELVGFGTTYFNDSNDFKQGTFAIVNARLGYEAKNYGVYLFANNLFDTEYLTQVLTTPPARGIYGAPATVGVQFRSQF